MNQTRRRVLQATRGGVEPHREGYAEPGSLLPEPSGEEADHAERADLEHFLAPTLKERQIVVMDNLQVHKSARGRELIEGVGAEILFLPPYSPDFSPIEEIFSKVKGILQPPPKPTSRPDILEP